ncbi:MAG: DUF402 domain-containing protein [Erysipelotrichaceae bacterium]|nr:DUF402 domain-containing protein [Erysipelotrichaceae bacterium]
MKRALQRGDLIYIQSYKHDGSLHRTWVKGFVLDITSEYTVAITNKTWVVEADGRRWLTREPAVCFFYHHKWYNVIAMIRRAGIYYYCNLASPSTYDGEAMKNIDYDLDVKFYPDGKYELLDEDEFYDHSHQMNYPHEVKGILQKYVGQLLDLHRKKKTPFNDKQIQKYFGEYQRLYRIVNH